jgi:hypothetical protein
MPTSRVTRASGGGGKEGRKRKCRGAGGPGSAWARSRSYLAGNWLPGRVGRRLSPAATSTAATEAAAVAAVAAVAATASASAARTRCDDKGTLALRRGSAVVTGRPAPRGCWPAHVRATSRPPFSDLSPPPTRAQAAQRRHKGGTKAAQRWHTQGRALALARHTRHKSSFPPRPGSGAVRLGSPTPWERRKSTAAAQPKSRAARTDILSFVLLSYTRTRTRASGTELVLAAGPFLSPTPSRSLSHSLSLSLSLSLCPQPRRRPTPLRHTADAPLKHAPLPLPCPHPPTDQRVQRSATRIRGGAHSPSVARAAELHGGGAGVPTYPAHAPGSPSPTPFPR